MTYTYVGYYQAKQYGIGANLPGINDGDVPVEDASDENEAAQRKQFLTVARNSAQVINRGLSNPSLGFEFEFVPRKKTRYFDALINNNGLLTKPDYIWNGGKTLSLYQSPMMQLDSATLGDSTSLVINTDVRGSPRNTTPIMKLELLSNAGLWTQYSDEYREAIEISGIWGYRTRFATEGFIDSDDSVNNPTEIDASQTNLIVNDAKSANTIGFAPRFDVGQVLRIESEYLIVTAISYTTNTITVLRGQLGTTAAIHANETQIDVFMVEEPIVEAAALIAAYEIERYGHFSNITREAGFTVSEFPATWPERAIEILRRYQMRYIGTV